jgi:hypothetical protein
MKNLKYPFIVLLLIGAIFAYPLQKKEKTMAEIYKRGIVRFIPEQTIDDSSMPEEALLEAVIDIAYDKKNNIYISDYKANNIKKFDSSGKFIKVIGRKGQGPGEFSYPFWIAVADDRLFVWDMMNMRLCALSLEGEFIKSITFQISEGRPQKLRSLPDGNVVIELEKIYFGEADKPQDCTIEIYSPDLEPKKTVYSQQVWRNKYMRVESVFTNIPQPFSPLVYWDVTPDGKIVIGYSKNYELEIYDIIKGKLFSFRHDYEPVKVTDEDKEVFFSGIAFSRDGVMQRGAPDFVRKNTEFPKIKPSFDGILIDSERNILVHSYRKNKAEQPKFFDAFDSKGNFLGTVKIEGEAFFPSGVRIRENYFWRQETDKEGLIKLVKYRISGE